MRELGRGRQEKGGHKSWVCSPRSVDTYTQHDRVGMSPAHPWSRAPVQFSLSLSHYIPIHLKISE